MRRPRAGGRRRTAARRGRANRRPGRSGRIASTKVVALAALLAAGACARGEGPTIESDPRALEPPPAGLARIYFYRKASPMLGAVSPEIVVNGRQVGVLSPGEVFYRDANPGRYEVLINTATDAPVTFRVQAGARRYVQVAPTWNFLGWRLEPALTSRPEAEDDMRGLVVTDGFPADDDAAAAD